MDAYIHRDIFGTKRHLFIHTSGEYSWTERIPDDAWVFSREAALRSVNSIMRLLSIELPGLEFEEHVRSLREGLDVHVGTVPWHLILSKKQFGSWCSGLVERVGGAVQQFSSDRYAPTFISNGQFLSELRPACIDLDKLQGYLAAEDNATIRKTLISAVPEEGDLAERVTYSMVDTSTGRLVVRSGPQVLTLPKKYRDIFCSKHRGGTVYQVDFISLEPRVARLLSGTTVERDVYEAISREIFSGELERKEVKLAVLCALYGGSARRLSNMLSGRASAPTVIRKVRKYFAVVDLTTRLTAQLEKQGYIENFYGRRLHPTSDSKNLLISHFLQSTAVDVALKGFSQLVRQRCRGLRVDPLLVIHDALLLDVHPSDDEQFRRLVKEGVLLDGLGSFPLSLDVVSRSA